MAAPLIDRVLGRAAAHRAKGATFDADLLDEAGSTLADLLEALKAARDHVAACWDEGDAEYADEIKADLDKIDAAIAKATDSGATRTSERSEGTPSKASPTTKGK